MYVHTYNIGQNDLAMKIEYFFYTYVIIIYRYFWSTAITQVIRSIYVLNDNLGELTIWLLCDFFLMYHCCFLSVQYLSRDTNLSIEKFVQLFV